MRNLERTEPETVLDGEHEIDTVALVRSAHDVIKSIDPECASCFASRYHKRGRRLARRVSFQRQVVNTPVDIIGHHCYVFPQPPEAMTDLIRRVKADDVEEQRWESKPLWCAN